MTESPKVSIVSACYNRGSTVHTFVSSLLNQNYDNFEVIIVNDASKDNTLEELKKFDDDRLKIIDQANTGFTVAIINAVQAAKGEYIAVHGSGDISLPDRIAKQAAVMDEKPNVGVVGCYIEELSNDEDVVMLGNDLPFFETLVSSNLFSHGEVMFRKSIYEKCGGYRPFFTFAQDRDLWLRMSQYCDYYIVQEVLYHREKQENAVSQNPEKQLFQACLSSFAVQCAERQKAEQHPKGDILDRYGKDGVFLKEPSEELARRLAGIAITHYKNNNLEMAKIIARKAIDEYRCKKTVLTYAAIVGAKNPLVEKQFSKRILSRWR